MSTPSDILAVYRQDMNPPVQVPAWATLPLHTTGSGRVIADGWSVLVVSEHYCGPERRQTPREPRLIADGRAVLPKQAGWLFCGRGE
jgi:hypothetical protein